MDRAYRKILCYAVWAACVSEHLEYLACPGSASKRRSVQWVIRVLAIPSVVAGCSDPTDRQASQCVSSDDKNCTHSSRLCPLVFTPDQDPCFVRAVVVARKASLVFRPSRPFPPTLDSIVDLVSSDSISDEPHCDTESLHILVPAFVVEEKHLVVIDTAIPMYSREMCSLAARIYLHVIEVVYRAPWGAGGNGYL